MNRYFWFWAGIPFVLAILFFGLCLTCASVAGWLLQKEGRPYTFAIDVGSPAFKFFNKGERLFNMLAMACGGMTLVFGTICWGVLMIGGRL